MKRFLEATKKVELPLVIVGDSREGLHAISPANKKVLIKKKIQ